MLLKNLIAALAAGSLLLVSCAKEGPTGPTGPAGPSQTGSIGGHVKLYDQYGSPVLVGLVNAKIYLNNSSVAVNPDLTGLYKYTTIGTTALTTGIYSLAATDSGYAATSKGNIQLVGGALNVDLKLSAIPDSFVYGFRAYHNAAATTDSLVVNLKPDTRLRNCIVFAHNSGVPNGQPAGYLWSKVLSVAGSTPMVNYLVPAQDLYDAGMAAGGRVYYTVYSYVVADGSVYEDFGTGKNVYNAVSGAMVDSTLVP